MALLSFKFFPHRVGQWASLQKMHGLLHSLTPVLLKVRLVFFVCECFVGVG